MPKVGPQQLPGLKAAVYIDSARKSLEGNHLLPAKKALDLAAACAGREKDRATALEQIAALRKQLDKAQDKLLAAMRKDLEAGKHFEALKRGHTYVRKFAGLRIAKAAAKTIEQARTDPALQPVDKKADSEAAYAEVQDLLERQWQQTLASAPCDRAAPKRPADKDLVAAMGVQQQAAVLKLLSHIVTSCPDTSAADEAGALDEALRATAGRSGSASRSIACDAVRRRPRTAASRARRGRPLPFAADAPAEGDSCRDSCASPGRPGSRPRCDARCSRSGRRSPGGNRRSFRGGRRWGPTRWSRDSSGR